MLVNVRQQNWQKTELWSLHRDRNESVEFDGERLARAEGREANHLIPESHHPTPEPGKDLAKAQNKRIRAVGIVLGQLGMLMWSARHWRVIHALAPVLDDVQSGGHFPFFHFAQDAEDIGLIEILPVTGFYVDVGAHHPERFSVTKLLYDRGWRGLNIDATPQMTPGSDFSRRRPRDINVYGLVGGGASEVEFYRFKEQALSTTNSERARFLMDLGEECESIEKLPLLPLREYLELHGEPGKPIDLLSVDVEGADLEVLESLNWDAQPIGSVLVEIGKPASSVADDEVSIFLATKGFSPALVFLRSVLFLPEGSPSYDHFRQ